MISITLRSHFDAAHQLDLPYDSPCTKPHGHRYEVEVTASAETLEHGMVIDYNVLKGTIDEFDHCDLNALPHFQKPKLPTTAENIAHVLAHLLQDKAGGRVSIDEVVVRETPHTSARWKKERPD